MSIEGNDVAIVIPSYNEGRRIFDVVNQIKKKGFHQIIVVDDGSTDASMDLLESSNVIILRHLINRGAGAATETGLKYCRENLQVSAVVMLDADTQHDTNDITKLLNRHFDESADITVGDRFIEHQNNIPAKNRFFNKVADLITSMMAGKWIQDSQSGFKVFNKNALYKIIIEHDKYEHCSEILIKANKYKLKVVHVPIKVYYPEHIKDKGQHLFNGIRTLINLLHSVLIKNK